MSAARTSAGRGASDPAVRLSVVATMYRSRAYVEEFVRRAAEAAASCTTDYEVVLVNDGSPDDSGDVARRLGDPRVVIVELSRNFGHHRAMLCGLEHARGERIFLIDIDLEEPPENLRAFWDLLEREPEVDVVVGEVSEKPGGPVRRLASGAFYRVFNSLSPVRIPEMAMVSRLMRRGYVEALLRYRESDPFLPALWVDAGFVQRYLSASKRFDGETTYTLRRRLRMALHAIASFSSMPLLYLFYVGAAFSGGSIIFVAALALNRIFSPEPVLPGWSSVIAALFFIGGVIIFALGVLGVYLSKIYKEVKARPNSIVRSVHRTGDIGHG